MYACTDFYSHTWNPADLLVNVSDVAAPIKVQVSNKPLTGELILHRHQDIMNAFDLVAICGTVSIVKIHLNKAKSFFFHM